MTLRFYLITEKDPTTAFSWLKVPTSAFTFKTLIRNYAMHQEKALVWAFSVVVIVCSSNFNQCVSVCVGLPDVSKHPPGILAAIIVMLHSYKTTSLTARSQGWCQCVVPIHASLPALHRRSVAAADWRWRYRYLKPGSGQPPRHQRHRSIAAILAEENMVQIFSLMQPGVQIYIS